MRNSSVKRSFQDSELAETPRIHRQSLKEKQRLSQDIKVKYIQELEDRNRKLKYEILKINQMLEEQKVKKHTQKKEHKLIPIETSSEVIQKQLQNAYKQIKNYEKQIDTLESKQAGGMITDKMSRFQNILKEKTTHLDKLKNQLAILTKTSVDNTKKLINNVGKEQLQNSMLKYNEQIKVLRQKVRETENREKKKAENAKKQYDYIKKLEKELVENGVAIDEIEQVKRNNIFNHIYEKINNTDKDDYGASRVQQNQAEKKNKDKQKEQPIEQMTVDKYMELQSEMKLFKKLQADYQKRVQNIERDKKQEEKRASSARDMLKHKQQEIKSLYQEIGELKSKIKHTKKVIPQVSQKSTEKTRQKPKVTPIKLKKDQPANVKTISDQTHIKYDEKGQATEKGQRFTDRNMLGKTTDIKIIGVKIWTDKTSFSINGIQCIYKVGDSVKPGEEHLNREGKRNCTQNIMDLDDGDYIKSIAGHLNQGNIIEYLVFISHKSRVGRFGQAKQTQKQFNFEVDEDQIPICMYGSIFNTKEGKKEGSLIENLGFEITRDKGFNKDDQYI